MSANEILKHEAVQAKDWDYAQAAALLHEWGARFNSAFDLKVETPAFQFAYTRGHMHAYYRRGRNGFGLRHEITFNLSLLDRPLADLLRTLLHELLHEWQERWGTPGKWNYHNKEYQTKAESLGLLVNSQGHNLGVKPGPFLDLLQAHGVNSQVLNVGTNTKSPQGKGSKLKKWSCACTNVWAATIVDATCNRCDLSFTRAAPK